MSRASSTLPDRLVLVDRIIDLVADEDARRDAEWQATTLVPDRCEAGDDKSAALVG